MITNQIVLLPAQRFHTIILLYWETLQMEQIIQSFRNITQDYEIDENTIMKFVKYGKGDIQQALNYYYNYIEKGKIKKITKQKPSQFLSNPNTSNHTDTKSNNIQQANKKLSVDRSSQISYYDEQQPNSYNTHIESVDAFSVLRRGSIQHGKTHAFIRKVREIYKLPIKGKSQEQLIANSKSCLPEHSGLIPEQFMMVDCLPQALNSQILNQMINKKNTQLTISKTKIRQSVKIHQHCSETNKNHNEINIENDKNEQSKQCRFEQQSDQKLIDLQSYQYAQTKFTQQKQKKSKQSNQKQITITNKTKNVEKSELTEKQIIKQLKKQKQKNESELQMVESDFPKQMKQNKIINYNTKIKDNLIKTQKLSNNKSQSNLQFDQLYLGQYFARAVSTITKKIDSSNNGSEVRVQTYMEDGKTKKRIGRKVDKNMNMRIAWEGRQIGRIADEEVRIILPLIENHLIRVQFFFHDLPPYVNLLQTFTLKAMVYIKNKLITQPIIQTFQPQQQDKQRVEQLSALFTKLNLPILTQPLIKAKSRYIKNTRKKNIKKQSIDIFQFGNQSKDDLKKKQEMEEKNRRQLHRIRNDPNYKQKQQSLADMMHVCEQNHKQIAEVRIEQEGRVKKKVFQIDTQQTKDKLSQLIQLHQQNCTPYYPQHNFVSQLYPYQALALAWMLRREGFLTNSQQKQQLHPLWTQFDIPTHNKYKLYFNELTGQVCLKRPTSILKCKGGILADEMGLGKTVMMTALIVSNPPQPFKQTNQAGSLVIVPLTLLSQWQSQIIKHTTNQKVIIYYSNNRHKILNTLPDYDIVISTYGTISHQYAQGNHTKKSGIYRYRWHRIILDEAHYIKGRIIQTSKSVYELQGGYRWCLTGTPIQNAITDIFSQVHFIKYTPWSQFACWTRFITKPLEDGDQSIYQILKTILKQVFLRRTKNTKGSDGKPIIELPPRISKVELLTMSTKQRQYYDSIYRSSRSSFDELIDKGILQAKYMEVLEMLMRLRQICCHPILFKSVTKFTKNTKQFQTELHKLMQKSSHREKQNQSSQQYYEPIIDLDRQQIRIKANSNEISEQYLREVLQKVANENLDNCIICLNQPEDPVITCCLHIFCKGCNIRQIEEKGSCSYCRKGLTKQDFIHLPRQSRLNLNKIDSSKEMLFPSTKMIALKEHLENLVVGDKVVVFSQFLGMLDLLQDELKKNSIKYVRMEGIHTHKERTKIVKQFQENTLIQVFLVSLKTAGVGLNLTAANKVFLMDPWWNPAVEQQAIERVHRIGQQRKVQIFRFVMDKTIETRMLQLNTEKKILSQNVLNQNPDKDGSSGNHKIQKLKYLMQKY